jgi:hypothetical protein
MTSINIENNNVKILLVGDTTGSMAVALQALKLFFENVPQMLRLVFPKIEFGCILYGDFDGSTMAKTKSAVYIQPYTCDINIIKKFLNTNANPVGGGDGPEAQKTAFMHTIYNNMLCNNTIVFHFTDAPPHLYNDTPYTNNGFGKETQDECEYFSRKQWSWKWCDIVSLVKSTQATLVTFSDKLHEVNSGYYKQLGDTVLCNFTTASNIMMTVMQQLQNIMGIGCHGISQFKISFSDIGKRLSHDMIYFDTVVSILEEILEKRMIEGAIDIFTNKITSEIWRQLLNFRSNDSITMLKDRMSSLANGTNPKQEELKLLIGESFNRMDAINELMAGKITTNEFRCFKASLLQKFPVDNLQTMFSCFSKVEAQHFTLFVQKMLESVETIPTGEETFYSKQIIPIDVDNKTFFSLITHLITPGYIASLRQSLIVALISLNDSRLKERADEFLMQYKGKWLNFTLKEMTGSELSGFLFPENVNMGFVLFLLCKRNRKYLTDEELDTMRQFTTVQKVYNSTREKNTIKAKVAFLPNNVITTDSFCCDVCSKKRPISLRVLDRNICAWCDGTDTTDLTENIRESNMSEKNVSCRSCNSIYSLMRPENLRIQPRCHYCRTGKEAPTVSCSTCKNKYIYPNYSGGEYICHCCKEDGFKTDTIDISIKTLFNTNVKALDSIVSIPSDEILDIVNYPRAIKTADLIEELTRNKKIVLFNNPVLNSNQIQLVSPTNMHIFNSSEIIDIIYTNFSNQKDVISSDECMICYEMVSSMESRKMCTNSNCDTIVCIQCIYNIFGNVKAGSIVELSTCVCPFCKDILQKDIAKFHPIASMKIPDDSYEHAKTNHMAWCCSCNNIKPHSDRICAETPPENVNNFICQQCINASTVSDVKTALNTDRIVACSSCNELVCKALIINGVENYACNHLTCHNPLCNKEVCGFEDCGKAFDSYEECYEHMDTVHGGWYDIKHSSVYALDIN